MPVLTPDPCNADISVGARFTVPFTARDTKVPPRVSDLWLNPYLVFVSWAELLLAGITPPQGFGFTVCWIKAATGLPCPGCGLTRSISCALRGMAVECWQYHPFGFLLLALFICVAAISLMPALRKNLTNYIDSRPKLFGTIYAGFVAAFVGFGILRALLHLAALCFTPL
jgi:hypothetical protein